MWWPLLALAGFGFVVSAKSKPKTSVNKLTVLGPRSGEMWDAELFPDAGLVVVHSRAPRTGTVAAFNKDPQTKRFVFRQGKGSETLLGMMRDDFEGEKPPV
jgi:hypothetical protein